MADHRRADWSEIAQTACWPLSWSSVWVGALAAIAVALIIGLAGVAIGAYPVGADTRIVSWHRFRFAALAWSVGGAFFSFVVGGWVAGTMRSARHAETAMLHGAVAWLVTVPMLLVFAALGAANNFGIWYGGLQGTPVWMTPPLLTADPAAAMVVRNAALGALTALLLGLAGSVLGGWLASGEPMTLTYYRTRAALASGSSR